MKLVQHIEYLVSTVDTDELVLRHQGISSYSAKYGCAFPTLYELTEPNMFDNDATK